VSSSAQRLGLRSPNRLRVLIYHDVPTQELAPLATQLRWLARSWNFVSADEFGAMAAGDAPVRGKNLLVSFDDGFASNRVAAEHVLNPLGIRALFFAVSDFVGIEDRDEARRFIARNIQPGSRPEDLPSTWSNMGWADLEALLEQGHTIGGHTRTHARLSQIATDHQMESEVIASADSLASRLGVSIEHFAYTFGDLASFSELALAAARRRFRFVYSGLRGDNAAGVSPFALRRDSVATQDARSNYTIFPNRLLGGLLEGAADFRYASARRQLDDWSTRNP
jgi:peptidoglycan/xylan/chitin deacetylase (PgdA/CDA1 family)